MAWIDDTATLPGMRPPLHDPWTARPGDPAPRPSDEVLLGSEAEWAPLIETLPHIVWITRPDGWHVHFNQQWTHFTGLTLEESLGSGWNPPFHPDDREMAAERWAMATATGEPYEIEYRLRRADGAYRWMLGRARPLRDNSGAIVRWFGTCTDIDDLKRAQAELEQSRALHRLAGSMARFGGWSLDWHARRMVWSDEIYAILDHPRDAEPDLEGTLALYLPSSRAAIDRAIRTCAADGTGFDLELELETRSGRRLWVRVMGEPGYAIDGSVAHVRGAVQDITSMKEASHRNEELADRVTTTLESITDAFFTLDRDWRFTYLNGRAEELLHRERESLHGQVVWDEFPAAVGTELETAYRRAMAEDVTVEIEEFHYPPLETWFAVTAYPSPQGLAVYFRDVTGQRRDRIALQERVKELHSLAVVNGGAHALTDAGALCTLAAESLVTAMERQEAVSAEVTIGDVRSRTGPAAPAGGTTVTVPILVAGDERGRVVVTDATHTPFLAEEERLVRAVAETLGLWSGRHEAAAALQDVNDELNVANGQLADAAQMKDDLLSMASHELRTPLTPILGFAELLSRRGDNLTPQQLVMTRSMASNARRMLRLVDDLLVVSRASAGALVTVPEPVPVAEAVTAVLADLGGLVSGVEVAMDDCRAMVDPQHLQQIAANLLTNATKYGAAPIVVSASATGDGRVRLEVADHGPGVPADFQARMWGRFVQKDRGDKRTATGTGLGLAIVKLLAEANAGTAGYRDNAPHGAVFTVDLPAADVSRGPAPRPATSP